jgi:excinuclease ABC subunit A
VIAASDWIIDLGPEGGEGGGAIVVEGPPEVVRAHASSHTGAALRDYAERARRKSGDRAAPGRALADV